MSFNRYIADLSYARVSLPSWKHNFVDGFTWDRDNFDMNFLMHPYSGGLSFSSARANGYSYWESFPFAFGGSLLWECFGETTRPSYDDMINTPVSGMFYGEVLFRLSSEILDDRTTGKERILRETGAAIVNPARFVSRLISGDLSRVTDREIYQKEPLSSVIAPGTILFDAGDKVETDLDNILIRYEIEYGNPFQQRKWKPFDYFKIMGGINFGTGRKVLEDVNGYGVLFGKTIQTERLDLLVGAFQHYSYFDNRIFELGTIGLNGGFNSKYAVAKKSWLYTNLHVGVVPFAGNNTKIGKASLQTRKYNYCGGLGTNLETGINLGFGSLDFTGHYYWLKTYIGNSGNNYIGILRPRITVKLYRNIHLGIEDLIYITNTYTKDLGSFHRYRTEQRLYLIYNL
jgi:hypothetical protein